MFHSTPDNQRICVATFHMDGEATKWVTWHSTDSPFINWMDFKYHICCRFDEKADADYHSAFAQAQQTSSVVTFVKEFKDLANIARRSTPQFHLQMFLASPKPKLGKEVVSFNPHSILEVKTLTKRHEDKFLSSKSVRFWP